MNDKIQKLRLNSIMGLAYQVTAVVGNMILPKFFLQYYGSSVNGLISSITQFLSFITLCDMGIGAVISSALYSPLAKGNNQLVGKIVAFSKKYFQIVGLILIGYVGVLTFVYPNLVEKQFSWLYIVSLLWAMAISQFGQYFIGMSYQILLNADQKSYVQYGINIVTLILNTVLSICIITNGGNVQTVKLSTSVIFLLRPLFMYLFVKKYYKLNLPKKVDPAVVPNKSSGIIQHISYMVYGNTDIAILTVLSSFTNVSIYSVYVLVNNGVKSLVQALTNGYQALFGNIIAEDDERYLNQVYDQYEWILHTFSTFVYTMTAILIVPFVLTYTKEIADADYNVPLFALLITLAYLLNTIREGMYIIIRAAGHYEQTKYAAVFEALVNIVVSIGLVTRFGLIGVAIGTLSATSFFSIYEVIYLSRNILKRNIFKFIKQFLVDLIIFFLSAILTKWIKISEYSYVCWIENAVVVGGICLTITIVVECLFYNRKVHMLINEFLKK